MTGQPSPPSAKSGQLLAEVHATFRRWFGDKYDLGALDAVLAAAAAQRLGGDPCWLLVIGGSGAAKTETIMPLTGAGAEVVSTITGEAALLSGTSEKERAADSHGGLLRQLGSEGILVIKDVTSILSMSRDARAEVLAALREIHDGRWERHVGTDGGRTLVWTGRLVVVGACTTAWDSAHSVVATMGDRFVVVRFNSREHRRDSGRQALRNVNREPEMRHQLAAAIEKLVGEIDPDIPVILDDREVDTILDLADVVTLARTAVERDYSGNVVQAHAPEMPTRYAKQLGQIARGAVAIGMNRADALAVACRCARDSMPPLRRDVLLDVAGNPLSNTSAVTKRVQLPRKTVDRALQELHLLGLLTLDEEPWGNGVRWVYSLADDIDPAALEKLARNGRGRAGRS